RRGSPRVSVPSSRPNRSRMDHLSHWGQRSLVERSSQNAIGNNAMDAGKSNLLSFFAALADSVAHCLGNHGRQTVGQRSEFGIHATELPLQTVDLLHQSSQIDAIKLHFDRRQIVAVAPALLKNVPRHKLLALDLSFEHADTRLEFLSCNVC